jgi:hypothetical protein
MQKQKNHLKKYQDKAKLNLKEFKRIGSRPFLEVDLKFLTKIEQLAFGGMKTRFIWAYFELTPAEWELYIKGYPEITRAVDRGRAKGVAFVESKMMQAIGKGDADMIKFYLKSRAEYDTSSTIKVEDNAQSNPVSFKLTVTDPVEASKIYQRLMGD